MDFVGIGDLHLSSQSGHGGFSRFIEDSDSYIISEVQRALDMATDKGIQKAILYGDICDSVRMSYNAHIKLVDFFRRNKEIDFHVILGNHDKFAKDSNLGHSCEVLQQFHLKNLTIYDQPKVIKFSDGTRVNFLPFPFHNFKNCLNVCHLDLSGAPMDNGKPTKSDILPKGYQIVSGHIHSSSSFKNTYYSGTLYQLTFGESVDRKGFHLIECNGDDAEVTYVPFSPRYTLRTVIVNDPSDLQGLPAKDVFYRLLLPEEAEDIDPSLYATLNVVEVKKWGTKSELSSLQELNLEFEQLNLDIPQMLESIVNSQYSSIAEGIMKTRERILART